MKPCHLALQRLWQVSEKRKKLFDFSKIKNEGNALTYYSVRVENPTLELVVELVVAPAAGLSEFTT